MRKGFLLLPFIAIGAYLTLSSNSTGYPGNRTGSDGVSSNRGCGGSGCHGSGPTTSTNVYIVVDSAGTVVNHYVPGVTYRVSLVGVNVSLSSLPKFGFQLSTVKSSDNSQAGTFVASSVPTNSTINSGPGFAPRSVLCHTAPKDDSVVMGASVYPVSVNWTAPASGTGTVKLYGVINAVDFDNNATSGDKWNYTDTTITELVSHVGVPTVTNNVSVSAYPNPVVSNLTLQLQNAQDGTYYIRIYDMAGRVVAGQHLNVNGNTNTTVDMSRCVPGVYQVEVERNGVRSVSSIVKQ